MRCRRKSQGLSNEPLVLFQLRRRSEKRGRGAWICLTRSVLVQGRRSAFSFEISASALLLSKCAICMLGYFRTSFSRQVAGTTPDLKSGAAKWGDGMGRMFVAAAAAAMVLAAGAGLTGTVAARRSQSGGPVAKVSSEPGAALSKPAPADAPDASVKGLSPSTCR